MKAYKFEFVIQRDDFTQGDRDLLFKELKNRLEELCSENCMGMQIVSYSVSPQMTMETVLSELPEKLKGLLPF